MNHQTEESDLTRRDFLRSGSFGTLMVLMGGVALEAAEKAKESTTTYKTTGNPVRIGLIGCGQRGREVLKTLATLPNAPVAAICDPYKPMLNRAKESAPNAKLYSDYKELLADKDVQAVVLATPTHQHGAIAMDVMKAGKHIFCEAPLATTVDEARAIARAAKENLKVHFQSGLQFRSDPQRHFLLSFIRSGSMGKNIKIRSQWQKKQSWRQASPNPDREREINWRLRKDSSVGIPGEIGIHQIDAATWFLNEMPISVGGYSSTIQWADGRDIPDTVQVDFEFRNGVRMNFEGTIANSFDSDYEVYYGTDSAIMVRENKAWMFKEVDAPMLGWEVYARKDQFYKETGIALVANATKIVAQGDKPVEEAPYANTPLYYALQNFLTCADLHGSAVDDFASNFDVNDKAALAEYLVTINKVKPPHAGYKEGFEATVLGIKAHEASTSGTRIPITRELLAV